MASPSFIPYDFQEEAADEAPMYCPDPLQNASADMESPTSIHEGGDCMLNERVGTEQTAISTRESTDDSRNLFKIATVSTDNESIPEALVGESHDRAFEENGPAYGRSTRRQRRNRRRRISIAIFLFGFLIMIIAASIFFFSSTIGLNTSRSNDSSPSPMPTQPPFTFPPYASPMGYPHSIVLYSNRYLEPGDFVESPSREYRLGLTTNGNFVLQDQEFNVLWSAGTAGGQRLNLQSDGNLVVRNSMSEALWTSRTYGYKGAFLMVDDIGQIALATEATVLWLGGLPRGSYVGASSPDLELPSRAIFYYPWFPETWTVNGQLSKFAPDLGLYSSSDPSVARAHVDALDYGRIDISVASWWGPDTNLDRARLSMLMDTTFEMGSSLKWSVYYEDEMELDPSVASIQSDLDYLKKWFAWHPTWAHVDGRPVIFVYNGGGCETADRWMSASKGEWFVILKIFSHFRGCSTQPDGWHQYGVNQGEPLKYDTYAFSIAPGFWRADTTTPKTPRVSREKWCENVELMASSDEPWHMIISFNEAGEGTNIEPSPHWSSSSGYGYYLDCLNQYPTVRYEKQ